MRFLTVLTIVLGIGVGAATNPAAVFNRIACQNPTANLLEGCPAGTILVSATDKTAKFTKIQAAVRSLKDDGTPKYILIDAGNYVEQVNVTARSPLTLLGVTSAPEDVTKNKVRISWAAANTKNKFSDNANTAVLTISPNYIACLNGNGSTGYPVPPNTPLGSDDFKAYNIDFSNNAFDYTNGPSLALSVSRSNASFYFTSFLSYQDTVYIGKTGNAYHFGNVIGGETDFLYGFGTQYIVSSTLLLRSCGGGIVAWKGTNTSFPNKYGAYISHSAVKAENASVSDDRKWKCALGRPWNSQHRSVFINTWLDQTILPDGYTKWIGTKNDTTHDIVKDTLLGEYESTGPGYDANARLSSNVTKELTAAEVAPYLDVSSIFVTTTGKLAGSSWIDPAYITISKTGPPAVGFPVTIPATNAPSSSSGVATEPGGKPEKGTGKKRRKGKKGKKGGGPGKHGGSLLGDPY